MFRDILIQLNKAFFVTRCIATEKEALLTAPQILYCTVCTLFDKMKIHLCWPGRFLTLLWGLSVLLLGFCYTCNLRSYIISRPLDWEVNNNEDAEKQNLKILLPGAVPGLPLKYMLPLEFYSQKLISKVSHDHKNLLVRQGTLGQKKGNLAFLKIKKGSRYKIKNENRILSWGHRRSFERRTYILWVFRLMLENNVALWCVSSLARWNQLWLRKERSGLASEVVCIGTCCLGCYVVHKINSIKLYMSMISHYICLS